MSSATAHSPSSTVRSSKQTRVADRDPPRADGTWSRLSGRARFGPPARHRDFWGGPPNVHRNRVSKTKRIRRPPSQAMVVGSRSMAASRRIGLWLRFSNRTMSSSGVVQGSPWVATTRRYNVLGSDWSFITTQFNDLESKSSVPSGFGPRQSKRRHESVVCALKADRIKIYRNFPLLRSYRHAQR
jgi:hypothetical protein